MAYEVLKPGGQVVFMDNYSNYDPVSHEDFKKWFAEQGFELEDIDLATETHPLIAANRKADLLVEKEGKYRRQAFGFRAVKRKPE